MPISVIVFCKKDDANKLQRIYNKLGSYTNLIAVVGDYPFDIILLVPTIIAKILLSSISTVAHELYNIIQGKRKNIIVLSLRLNERCSKLINKIKLRVVKTMFKIMSIFVPEAKPYLENFNMIVLKGTDLENSIADVHKLSLITGICQDLDKVSIALSVTDDDVQHVTLKDFIEQIKSYLEFADYRMLKFPCVGLIGTFVNIGSLELFTRVLGIPLHIAGALAIELSVLNNFTLHEVWTFRRKNVSRKLGDIVVRFFKFNLACFMGILVNYVLLILLHMMLGMPYAVADLLGILAGSIVNYLFSDNFVWTVKRYRLRKL